MKVLLFQVFDRQKVVQIDEEPIHICGSGQSSDLFLVCLKSGKINVYSAANDVPLVYTFPTHSRIVFALEHSQEHGIVATIEPEAAQSAINVVRVYKLPLTQALRPYFTQTNESEDGPDDSEDVRTYQLPLHASAKAVAVCPKTGKIAVATETDISVWAPAGTNRYEKVYQIEMAAVRIVAIHGPYLAYCTDRTVSVFECLVVRNKSVNSNNGSSSSDSNNFTGKATKSVPKVRLHSGPFPVRDNEQTVVMKSHGSSSISANVAIPWYITLLI